MFDAGTSILFQGDSITDGARGRSDDLNHILGHGYAYLIAARLGLEYPDRRLRFVNRGCSGNRVVDLRERWQEDAVDLAPDVISILVGVNDVGASSPRDADVSVACYEEDYRSILAETREALPGVRFVLCEPFALPAGARKDDWPGWKSGIDKRRDVVARLAAEFDAVLVRTQERLDSVSSDTGAEYWLWDGVHPMPAGHELLARAWLSSVRAKELR